MARRSTGDDRLITRSFVVLWLCGLANFLGMGAVNPLLPRFVKDSLGRGDAVIGLVVAVIAISAVAVRPAVGTLADRRGRRLVTIGGAAVTAVSFALYAIPNIWVLLGARLLTGAGQALFFTGAATMVTELSPRTRQGEAVSYFSIAVYLGIGSGPAIGEWSASTWTTAWGFVVAGLLGVAATVIATLLIETRPASHDEVGSEPVRRISRAALAPGYVLALGMVSNVAFASFMPLYADELGMAGAASVYLVYAVVVILVRLFGARLPDILGPSRCGTTAALVIALGMASIAVPGTTWGLYVGAVTVAIGISFLYPSLMALVVDRTTERERSSAVATLTMFFDVAAGVGGLALGLAASAAGYRATFATAAVAAVGALAILQLVVLRKAPAGPAPDAPPPAGLGTRP